MQIFSKSFISSMGIVKSFRFVVGVIFCFGLFACVSSTPYGPANRSGFGYADQRIDSSRYRVTFRGNAATRRETVENFLLYRSAELTVQNGFDYFVVVENDTEARSYFTSLYGSSFYGTTFSPFYGGGFGPRGFGRGRFGRGGFRGAGFGAFPYYPYGFGFGPGYGANSVRENTQYSAIAFISLHNGEKPEDQNAAFDAREVLQNIGPTITSSDDQ